MLSEKRVTRQARQGTESSVAQPVPACAADKLCVQHLRYQRPHLQLISSYSSDLSDTLRKMEERKPRWKPSKSTKMTPSEEEEE